MRLWLRFARQYTLEPRKYALTDLFEGNLVYVVPNYQRLYVWDEADQWEPLWLDVREIADELLQQAIRANCKSVDPDSAESHFLGAVVLKMSGSTPDLSRRMRVIDGQQRLTTLQLLVAASVAALEESDLPHPAHRLRDLTSNSSRSSASGVGSYKIDHRRHKRGDHYEKFSYVMGAALGDDTTANISGPMAECYRFFRRNILTWLDSYDR